MSPDPDQQSDYHSDDMELVGFPQHNQPRQRGSKKNDNYQVVNTGAEFPNNSSYEEDDDEEEGEDGNHEAYEEDEGLISQLGSGVGSESGSTANNLDDYFMYGFSHHHGGEHSAIDWRCAFWLGISFLLAACMAIILPGFNNFGKPIVKEDGTMIFPNGTTTNIAPINKIINTTNHFVGYTCPMAETVKDAENYSNTTVEESYNNRTTEIENNFTGFLDTFHESEFDGWGKTYDFVKAGMYHWKSTRFPKHLKDGDTIYESACGIGLNLIMTLEILQEVKGVNNLIVYGNEYLNRSAATANLVLDALLPPLNATKGSICTGDSSDLHFVPSASFDLVFTGYISTLLDPLDLHKGVIADFQNYEALCEGKSWEDQKLAEVAQQKQKDWFGVWVADMIRIAKPGAPVIIEQISYPFCEATFDWGGVNQDFWTDYAIEKYGWDIDPNSIEFEDDRLFRKRYHVFMRKTGLNATKIHTTPVVAPATPATPPAKTITTTTPVEGGGE